MCMWHTQPCVFYLTAQWLSRVTVPSTLYLASAVNKQGRFDPLTWNWKPVVINSLFLNRSKRPDDSERLFLNYNSVFIVLRWLINKVMSTFYKLVSKVNIKKIWILFFLLFSMGILIATVQYNEMIGKFLFSSSSLFYYKTSIMIILSSVIINFGILHVCAHSAKRIKCVWKKSKNVRFCTVLPTVR